MDTIGDILRDFLKDCIQNESGFVELRYHKKEARSISAERGRIENTQLKFRTGVAIRVLVNGTWGFSYTGEINKKSVQAAIVSAKKSAQLSSVLRKEKIPNLPPANFAVGSFIGEGITEVTEKTLEEKIALVMSMAGDGSFPSSRIQSIACGYSEIYEEKAIVTTDGADVFFSLIRPEFRINAVASQNGVMQVGSESIGVTGGWTCLFKDFQPAELREKACKTATDLLDSKLPLGGTQTVILAPSIVGLLVHEAIGHTVEADFVLSGSAAAGKLGQQVASHLVTLCDSGISEFYTGAGGSIPVDDEGVLTEKTTIIEKGVLKSYLHNRETAEKFGVKSTGSARAWEFSDVPLIRMRNTYIEPGNSSLQEMIDATKSGYLLEGPKNGQADSNGEFMFAVQKAHRIENGKIVGLVKGVSSSGMAFDVMKEVDMVSKEFKWDLGSGYCGKGQPAKVDAGGPYIRTKLKLGGTNE
jgi:TldD protein